ncbi:MAG: hypothetical protein IMY72_08275 [Bacteroidetes bacterium]|nr:hypothetical protein [Bacteroidota bacterium]
MEFDIKNWYNKMNRGDVLISFKGVITPSIITDILDLFEIKLVNADVEFKIVKRIYNVLVESLQNLYHHSDKISGKNSFARDNNYVVFFVTKKNNTFTVSTGNLIKKSKSDHLIKHIEHLNSLTKDEIRTLYKVILNNQNFSEKGGGGLGMIDLVRKTGGKLDYKVYDFSDEFLFFNLNVYIS